MHLSLSVYNTQIRTPSTSERRYCKLLSFFFSGENTASTLGRIVLLIWLFVVFIVTSSYTASLTSILTVQQLSTPITGIESLVLSNLLIGFQIGSFAENYLREELNVPTSRLRQLGSPEEYADALERGYVAAVVDERPYVELFLSSHCKFQIVGQEFTKSGWGFVSISVTYNFYLHYLTFYVCEIYRHFQETHP